jgi:hypothetical protein
VQAGVGVFGLPGALDPQEAATLHTQARNSFPGLEVDPVGQMLPQHAVQLATQHTGSIPPVWFLQARWADRGWVARWGHRMLALDYSVAEGERYATFGTTVRPQLVAWLDATRKAHEFAGSQVPASMVLFAYVNRFVIKAADPDLSKWFRFNFAIQATGADEGLTLMSVGARINRSDQRSRVVLTLVAERDDEGSIVARVHTACERDLGEGLTLASADALLPEIEAAKMVAKETFFSFATEHTLEHMGAVDDAASPA